MKYLVALAMGAFLLCGIPAVAGPLSEADAKWLEVVQKKVAKGELKVSTPKEERVQILKKWAEKQGWTAKVTKATEGFAIELSKSASNVVKND